MTMEKIIMHIASKYINIPLENANEIVKTALGEIAQFVKADRAYVFDYNFEAELATNTLEWCADGITPQIQNLQKVPLSMVPEWVEKHKKGEDMYIEDVDELKEGGLKKILKGQDIKSLLSLPMMKGKDCMGFVGFDSVKAVHKYEKKERKLLYLFSQLLVNIEMRKELLEAEEKASYMNKAKTEFLSNLSHELRTPLSGIIAAIETVMGTEKKPENRYLLKMALNSSLQLEQIFSDLYEIVRLNNGKVAIQLLQTNPSDLLDEVNDLFQISAEEKNLSLTVQKNKLPETIYTDQKLLRQILDKLVENAIKFTTEGTVTITASYIKTTDKHGTLILSVSDTGIGIDEETQNKIFEIFYQKDLSLTKEFKGLGLGLPMVSSIVEKMNGRITLESIDGKGTSFTVKLPVYNKDPAS